MWIRFDAFDIGLALFVLFLAVVICFVPSRKSGSDLRRTPSPSSRSEGSGSSVDSLDGHHSHHYGTDAGHSDGGHGGGESGAGDDGGGGH
jgi:hypothetical protein